MGVPPMDGAPRRRHGQDAHATADLGRAVQKRGCALCGAGAGIEFDFTLARRIVRTMATAVLQPPKPKRRWTYDEMAAELPETNQPTELWDGEIIMSAAPHPFHQRIVFNVAELVKAHVKPRKLGEVFISPIDVVLGANKVVQPDVVFVAKAKAAIVQACIRGAPDLVVEVISEGTWRRDRVDKKALYEQCGVAEYWIIDPESRLIEVFALAKGAYQLHARGTGAETVSSKLLAGLKVAFAKLEE
jgi:Uma2 family endonuclease